MSFVVLRFGTIVVSKLVFGSITSVLSFLSLKNIERVHMQSSVWWNWWSCQYCDECQMCPSLLDNGIWTTAWCFCIVLLSGSPLPINSSSKIFLLLGDCCIWFYKIDCKQHCLSWNYHWWYTSVLRKYIFILMRKAVSLPIWAHILVLVQSIDACFAAFEAIEEHGCGT